MMTLQLIAFLGAGVLLLLTSIMIRKICRGVRHGVTGVVTAAVHCCVKFTIHFILFGRRIRIPEFNFRLNWIQRVALALLGFYSLLLAPGRSRDPQQSECTQGFRPNREEQRSPACTLEASGSSGLGSSTSSTNLTDWPFCSRWSESRR